MNTTSINALEQISCDLSQVSDLLNVFLRCTSDKIRTRVEKGSAEENYNVTVLCRNMPMYCTLLEVALDNVDRQIKSIDCVVSDAFAEQKQRKKLPQPLER